MQADERASKVTATEGSGTAWVVTPRGLDSLIRALVEDGYRVIGPTLSEGAIILDEIRGINDLPAGYRDAQSSAAYCVEWTDRRTLFDSLVGAHSWKQYLFPSEHLLWSASRKRKPRKITFHACEPATEQYAFLGVRACDLAAMQIQDRVLIGGNYVDPVYAKRRQSAFIVTVNCTRANATCFCVSMHTGPRAKSGFDIALTEIPQERDPVFLLETGSERGARLLARIPSRPAGTDIIEAANTLVRRAAEEQQRSLDPDVSRQLVLENLNHSRWHRTGERCLACGNCTLVCPTCFCTTVQDTTSLSGASADRRKVWDSCFNRDHSYIHGEGVRKTVGSRYRQWIMHKLATWHDQFGTAGCVGCGRCITWCPVGIDITEEIDAINPNGTATGARRTASPEIT